MNYERIYIQYNDLVFDGYGMLDEYDASDVSFKVTTHPRSFGHGSYAPFKSDTFLADESSVSMTLWLKEKKLPCDQRPFYRDFVIEQLSHHGRLWAVQNNTLVWAYATVSSYGEMVEHYNGKVGIDVDFLLYEGIWHKADKQKTFLHPYDVCSFMECYDYKQYQPCLEESIMECPGVDIDPQSDEGYIVTFIKEDYRDGFESLVTAIEPNQLCAPWDGTETDETAYNFRASDTDGGNREIGNIVGGTIAWNQLVQDHGDEKTLTGDIVTFDDAEDYSYLTSLTIPLEPVQDLHGYDAPWVGGAGKNKLDVENRTKSSSISTSTYSLETCTCVKNGTTYQTTSTGAWSKIKFGISGLNEGQTYTFSALFSNPNEARVGVAYHTTTSWAGNVLISQTSGRVSTTFTFTSDITIIAVLVNDRNTSNGEVVTVSEIQLEEGTTATSYAPYSNICPISGWDGVEATRTGVNVWDEETRVGAYNSQGVFVTGYNFICNLNPVSVIPNTSYVSTKNLLRWEYDASMTLLVGAAVCQSRTPFTVSASTKFINFRTNYEATTYNNDISINYPATATTYEPYQGDTYSKEFKDAQDNTITVYGGGYEFISGALESTMAMVDLGTLNWSTPISANPNCFTARDLVSLIKGRENAICDTYAVLYGVTSTAAINAAADKTLMINKGNEATTGNYPIGTIIVKDSDYASMTAAEFKAAMSGVHLVYELATPQTYQLTPTQIQTLLGTNNVWADAGAVTVTYTSKYGDYELTDHKYLMRKNGVDSYVTGGTQTLEARKDNLHDLTLMLGHDIADYLYANGGFRELFPAPYYQYNAGELISVNTSAHITTGINQWDEEWENGYYDTETHQWRSGDRVISKNPIRVLANTRYHAYYPTSMTCVFYNANGEHISHAHVTGTAYFDTPADAYTMRFCMFPNYGSVYNNDICISLYNSADRYIYEPYEENIYPLDSSLTLRGVPLLDSIMKYDGDTYRYDGLVTRNFAVIDLGTKTWRKDGAHFYTTFADMAQPQNPTAMRRGVMLKYAASSTDSVTNLDDKSWLMAYTSGNAELHLKDTDYSTAAELQEALSGVLFVYPLRNPTTETAEPYTLKHIVNEYGTEEYVDHAYYMGERDVSMPVGHVSHYALACLVYGHDGVDVHVTGINVWNEQWEQGYLNTTTGAPLNSTVQIRSKDFIPVAPNEEYYLSCPGNGVVLFYDENKNYLRWTAGGTFTVPADAYYIKFYTYSTYGGTYNDDISINYPATETEYHPYVGGIYPVTWEDDAGTVYKASVDIAKGTMKIYMVGVEMSTLDIQRSSNGTFTVFLADKAAPESGVIDYASDIFEAHEPINDESEAVNGLYAVLDSANTLIIRDVNYLNFEDRAEFLEFVKGQYLYYTLAEPIVKEFTPYSLPMMDGLNNILIEGSYISYESTGVHEEGESCVYEHEPIEPGSRYCCDCDCDKVTKDMALCYHLDDLQDVYKYCSNAGFRVIYDCDAAERFFNIIGQKICVTNCHNGVIAGKIYAETDLPTDGMTITLVGKMHNPYVEINGNGNWIAGDYDGRLRIESSGDVYYENDCCSDPLEPDVWQKPSDMNYGWKILPRYNRILVNLGDCCGKACAYFEIDNITI